MPQVSASPEVRPSAATTPAPERRTAKVAPSAPRTQGLATPAAAHAAGRADELATTLARAVGRRAAPAQAVLQRSKASAKQLTKLAQPQIGPAPALDVQQKLVAVLEATDAIANPMLTEINLGGIVITDIPDDDEQLIYGSQLIDLQPPQRVSAGSPRFADVEAAGAKQMVVENTLRTMIAAGQIDYLRKSGLPNDEWTILVEAQYIRSRPKDQTGFHKDTKGQTLFVNLNYHIPQRVLGPESVVNPRPSPVHDEAIRGTLPQEFRDDLAVVRATLPDPDVIGARVVEPYGFVAFVDEAIHHATPLAGHRFVRGSELRTLLVTKDPSTFAEAEAAYRQHRGQVGAEARFCQRFATKRVGRKWWMWLEMIEDPQPDRKYTRPDFERTMTSAEVDLLLEEVGEFAPRTQAGAGGFYWAAVPSPGLDTELVAVKPREQQPLKRTVSQPSFDLPTPLPDDMPRRFFRTWVRAIPRRFVRGSELKEVLSAKVPPELLEQAQMVYTKYRDEPDGEARFRKSLRERGFHGTRTWWMWMRMIYQSQTDRKFSRADLERTMDPDEVELWLKTAEHLAPRGPLEEV